MFKNLYMRTLKNLKARFDSPLFTYEELRNMFIPLLLDQLFIFGIGMLSTMMVASSGEGSIAAMNMGGALGNLSYALFSAIAIGGGIVISRAKGATDPVRIREAIAQSCVVCSLCGLILGFSVSFFGRPLVRMLYPSVDPVILDKAGEYLSYFGLSIIPYSLFQVIFTAFRSVGDTKSSLILTLIINSIHLIGSLIFINVFKMGVAGAGLSFLTARVVGTIASVYWLMRKKCTIGMKWSDFLHYDKETLRDIFVLGVPLSIEQMLFQGGMVLVQRYITQLPTYQMDANGIANSIFMLYHVFAYSMQTITSTVCGQCIGAKDVGLTKKYCNELIFVGRFIMVFAIIVIMPITPLVMLMYHPAELAVPYIWQALLIGALPMPVIWLDAFLTNSATRAAGDSTFATVISLIALGIGRMACGYLFTITLGMGVPGIWLGQLVEWIFRGVVYRLRMSGNKWVKARI